ncbi:hypothetical protein HanRHA438_Chr04g0181081 [Helianthus annuus]|nr:hypothetical protein HanIR_Chr04g0185041 [Helianthus annuus]KAJ0927286.1 hypothetical protein HanRHA438_Chr04g0181081 [Helianthus annuus]
MGPRQVPHALQWDSVGLSRNMYGTDTGTRNSNPKKHKMKNKLQYHDEDVRDY